MLAQTLADIRKRIAKRPKLTENDAEPALIEPILAALAWDAHCIEVGLLELTRRVPPPAHRDGQCPGCGNGHL
jgi:hypothetical protein